MPKLPSLTGPLSMRLLLVDDEVVDAPVPPAPPFWKVLVLVAPPWPNWELSIPRPGEPHDDTTSIEKPTDTGKAKRATGHLMVLTSLKTAGVREARARP